MPRLSEARRWLCNAEKHPWTYRVGHSIWWGWRWQLDRADDIDILPNVVAEHLPKGASPGGHHYATRQKALTAAAEAVAAATKAGWKPTRIA